eukprot:3828748-Rhodomonas_salina.1
MSREDGEGNVALQSGDGQALHSAQTWTTDAFGEGSTLVTDAQHPSQSVAFCIQKQTNNALSQPLAYRLLLCAQPGITFWVSESTQSRLPDILTRQLGTTILEWNAVEQTAFLPHLELQLQLHEATPADDLPLGDRSVLQSVLQIVLAHNTRFNEWTQAVNDRLQS